MRHGVTEKEELLERIDTMNAEELILLSVAIDCAQSLRSLKEFEVTERCLDCLLAHCVDTSL